MRFDVQLHHGGGGINVFLRFIISVLHVIMRLVFFAQKPIGNVSGFV